MLSWRWFTRQAHVLHAGWIKVRVIMTTMTMTIKRWWWMWRKWRQWRLMLSW